MAHQVAPEVTADLDRIWYRIATQSGGNIAAADRLVDAITQRFYLLGRHPHVGRTRDHDLRPGLRSYPVGDYVIVYTIDRTDAVILYVFDGRRDIPRLLDPPRGGPDKNV
jgi:toxin ParE1/3/4